MPARCGSLSSRSHCRWLRYSPLMSSQGASAGAFPAIDSCSKSISSTGSPILRSIFTFAPDGGSPRCSAVREPARLLSSMQSPGYSVRTGGASSWTAPWCSTPNAASASRPTAAGSGMSSRTAGCFRTLPLGKTCCSAAGSFRRGKGARPTSTMSSICSASPNCSTAGRVGSPAARSSAWRSAAHCWRARGCC